MTGTRFNDIHVEGRKREQQYDKSKIILFILPFIFLSFLFESPANDELYHRDPVHHDMVIFVSYSTLVSPSPVSIYYSSFFFSMYLDFYSLFFFPLCPPRFLK